MWHKIEDVERQRREICRPVDGLVDFAIAHKDKFGVIVENGHPLVSTWWFNDLEKAFNDMEGEDESSDTSNCG